MSQIKLIKNKIQLICWSCSIIMGLAFSFLYLSWTKYFEPKSKINYQISSQARTEITSKIHHILNKCGQGYWLSWLIVDNDIYSFEQVKGFNPNSTNPDHIQSAKELNPFYMESHSLDQISKRKLQSMDTGFPAFLNEKAIRLLINQKGYVGKSLHEALTAANNKLYYLWLAVTKSSDNEVVYIFTVTSSNRVLNKCSQQEVHNEIRDLSIYAKRGL